MMSPQLSSPASGLNDGLLRVPLDAPSTASSGGRAGGFGLRSAHLTAVRSGREAGENGIGMCDGSNGLRVAHRAQKRRADCWDSPSGGSRLNSCGWTAGILPCVTSKRLSRGIKQDPCSKVASCKAKRPSDSYMRQLARAHQLVERTARDLEQQRSVVGVQEGFGENLWLGHFLCPVCP